MRFIDSWTNKEDRLSEVEVGHKGNIYIAKAVCHPDDEFSEFTGCRYAEMRAEIKALKDEYRQKKHDCEECRKFVAAVQQYSKFNKEDPSARAMFRQLNRRIREVNALADEINKRELALRVAIRQQDKFKSNKETAKAD